MSNGKQNVGCVLPEYTVGNLGTSFKVILVDSAQRIPGDNGADIFIPDYQGLVKQIAVSRAAHPLKLKGGDIRFLRKTLGLKAKELAGKLDISAEHLSRCEAGDKTLSPNSEKVLRTLVILEAVYVLQRAVADCTGDHAGLNDKVTNLLVRLKEVVSGLKISSVHAAGEELVIYFRRVARTDVDAKLPDDSREWCDEAA
jgi:DNA-binding transcriptional regulator YiaG